MNPFKININTSENYNGYLWAFLALFAAASVYVFSKAALNFIDVVQFGFYWFAFGTIWSLVFINLRSFYSRIKSITGQAWRIYIVIGILEMITTSFFYFAIKTIENPSIASFLSNLTPILVLILGYFFLKEKFTPIVIAGMVLTIIGALIISYRVDTGFSSFFKSGSGYAYLASSFYAISLTITRKNIGILYPRILTFNRSFLLFVFFAMWILVAGQDFKIPQNAYLPIIAGSFTGPFLYVLSAYNALKHIEAGILTVITSARSLIVMLVVYLLYDTLPYSYQILGGILTISGVIMVSLGKMSKKSQY